MKHFRDLVLSTREPALHNVLWIEPKKDEETGKYIWGEYLVKMFEDGWKVLFGGGGTSSNGLGFVVLNPRTGLTQLYDVRDPDNHKEIYPVTKAANVYLSNTIDVETAINNINAQLRNITSNVRKAVFAMDDMIEGWEASKAGKTFWVYDHNSSLNIDGYFTGELFLRKYTTNSSYTREPLNLSDIVMAIDDEVSGMQNTRMWYVNTITSSNAQLLSIVDFKDLIQLRNSLNSTYIQDIQVDGVSVVNQSGTPKIGSISEDVRNVYMINYSNLETYYPGNDKKDKIFFFKQGENNKGSLSRYTSSTAYEEIPLKEGDLLYNLDSNFDFIEKGLYVVIKEGTYPQTVLLIPNELYISDMIYQALVDATDNAKSVFIDFEVTDTRYLPNGNRSFTLTTEATVQEIYSYAYSDRFVFARIVGIENQKYDTQTPMYLPLEAVESGTAYFSGYKYPAGYSLMMTTDVSGIGSMMEIPLQGLLTFDNVPTQDSNNPVKSGGVYSALQDKADASSLSSYVLLSTYNNRMATTPKFHRAEFLDGIGEGGEYDVWNGDADNGSGVITDSSTHAESARECFESMWWAVYESNKYYPTAETPKLILRNGNVACYCWSNQMSSASQHSTATQIRLRFFDGISVISYELISTNQNIDYPNQTVIEVTKTTQAI